eukprot:gene19844-26537_t
MCDMKSAQLWDKSWDDDSLDDRIGQQLRAELPKLQQQQPAAPRPGTPGISPKRLELVYEASWLASVGSHFEQGC